ncbi:DUF4129 domain-containing protein [Bacillus suaedae]|uniref:DUF4129 domain-containing protein n=1 Tax=Halalkalibacter suaedae TaxID=2822140 RepID=A0A940X0F7_9BACI|nr:DUF4129 domain-containing protein [Bacillus suaedae]MBP3952671.1 DUF4129 domain-containing protein [Bacillus suaedae]
MAARDELEAILSKEEYTQYYDQSQGFFAKWIGKAWTWFLDQLAKLFPAIERSSGVPGMVYVVAVVVVVVVLAIVLFLISRNIKRRHDFRENKPLQSMNEINWSSSMHMDELRKREQAGDYKSSTRHLFLALLLHFHENKWLEARIWKTNWEYYDELQKVDQQAASMFNDVALLFDKVTYGEHIVTENEYMHYRGKVMEWLDSNLQTSNQKEE